MPIDWHYLHRPIWMNHLMPAPRRKRTNSRPNTTSLAGMSGRRRRGRSDGEKSLIEAWKDALMDVGDDYVNLLRNAGMKDESEWLGEGGYARGYAELAEMLVERNAPPQSREIRERCEASR